MVPLDLFPEQVQLILDYENFNDNIVDKYRQAGVTTVTAAWISKILQMAKPEKPEKILIVANKRDTAIEMATKIKDFLKQWPDWINVGFDPDKNSESRFRLLNGSEVKAVATSKDALRGFAPTILVFDEAAHIEEGDDFWGASMAAMSTGGKTIMISTPNGFDPLYYAIYSQAKAGKNDFRITEMAWYNDPRYAKDLQWVKTNDIVHYMLNRELYNDNEVVVRNVPKEEYKHYLETGYRPFSSWYEMMAKKFKFDRRKIAQELECNFLGSGDNVIPSDTLKNIVDNMVKDPIEKYMTGLMWQWKEPIKGHRYIMGVDVSRGDSEDYSAINIIDFDDREQVLEYVGKMPPDDLAAVAYKWGKYYEAFIVVDITGGMGVATSRKLVELEYKDVFIDGINTKDIWAYDKKMMDKIPGINFNNKRTQIVASLEEQLRHDFIIRSRRLADEINTFVYINGRPDHVKGMHDDAIMSISIALYAGDISFTQLKRNESVNKAMLDSWALSERSYDATKSFYSYGTSFDPIGMMTTDDRIFHQDNPMMAPKQAYQEYSWLFGKPKK